MTTTATTPRIFVTCLASYNAGNLIGKWIDLDDYSSADDLKEAISEYLTELDKETPLDGGEVREEYFITDYEGFPETMYSEYMDFEPVYEYMEVVSDMDEDRLEAFTLFVDNNGGDFDSDTKEQFEEAYQGQYNSTSDFTEQLVDELGYLDQMPENIRYYFDYDKFERDLFISDYWESNGHIFRNI